MRYNEGRFISQQACGQIYCFPGEVSEFHVYFSLAYFLMILDLLQCHFYKMLPYAFNLQLQLNCYNFMIDDTENHWACNM